MNKRAFSLIELSIVLTIIGLIIGGSLKAMRVMRDNAKEKNAKVQIATAKEALIGDALEYGNLSSVTNFYKNLSPIAGNQKKMFYYPDSNLVNDICSYSTTNLEVNIYKNGTVLRTIPNVAFVTAAAGANSNLQTGVTKVSGKDVVNYYDYTMFKDDGSDPISRASDRDDDPLNWVTLSELKADIRCNDKPFRFLNDRLPTAQVGSEYNATLFVENNLSAVSIKCSPLGYNLTFASATFSGSPNPSGTLLTTCTAKESPPASRSLSKQFVITIDPSPSATAGSGGGGSASAQSSKGNQKSKKSKKSKDDD